MDVVQAGTHSLPESHILIHQATINLRLDATAFLLAREEAQLDLAKKLLPFKECDRSTRAP